MASNSSYLIDVSKKCVVVAAGCIEDTDIKDDKGNTITALANCTGLYWTALGDIADNSLSKIGIQVIEDWVSAEEELKKSFDQIMKPAQILLKNTLSNIPIFKKLPIDNNEDFRTTMIYSYVLLKQFVYGETTNKNKKDNEGKEVNAGQELADDINKKFQKTFAYTAPMRKSPPKVSPITGGITIDFAYGKCNIYDAYYEVYLPLKKIQEKLMPKPNVDEENGTMTYTGMYKVPYTQQAFGEMLTQLFTSATKSVSADSSTGASTTDPVGENTDTEKKTEISLNLFDKIGELKKVTADLEDNPYADASLYIQEDNSNGLWSKKLPVENVKANIDAPFNKLNPKNENLTVSSDFDKNKDGSTFVTEDTTNEDVYSSATTYLQDRLDKFTTTTNVPSEDSNYVYEPDIKKGKKKIKITKLGNKNTPIDLRIQYKKVAANTKAPNIDEIMDSFINFEPYAIAGAQKNLASALIKNQNNDIYLGFPSLYCSNLTQLNSLIGRVSTVTDDTKVNCKTTPRIIYKYLLIQKFTITMDFKNLDERGYPMAGQFKIDQTWSLYVPTESVKINEITGNEDKYIEPIME